MRKTMKLALLICLALLVCALMFTACNNGNETQTPSDTTDVTTSNRPDDENTSTEDTHTHAYTEKWVYDTSNHWHECQDISCTTVTELSAHTWNNENTCTVCDKHKHRFIFTLENGTYTITEFLPMTEEGDVDLIIPSTHRGIAVTKIAKEAFKFSSSLVSVTIPDTIEEIGAYAFEDCNNLTSITIPDNVKSVGYGAFQNCDRLSSVTIESGSLQIGSKAFYGCSRLNSITLGNGITSIGESAFNGTKYYDSLANWENGVLYIGNYLIKAETTLSGDYAIKNGTLAIAKNAFYNCSSLVSVTIPQGVVSIPNNAFQKSGIRSIDIPTGVINIGDYAFQDCISLKTVTIPNSVTSIGSSAFSGCRWLSDMTIGNGVTKIYTNAFANAPCGRWENDLFYIGNYLITASPSVEGAVTVDAGTNAIADSAFYNCYRITAVTLPDSIKSIGMRAFEGCSNLASINLPNGITDIGQAAFSKCACLTSVTIPSSVTNLSWRVFEECTSLVTVNIEANISEIGSEMFDGCYSLTSVNIPQSVTSIGSHAFYKCEALTEIILPDGVTNIGLSAFWGCSRLKSINIPTSIQRVDAQAFEGTEFFKNKSNWENEVFYFGNCLIKASTTISGEYTIKEGTLTIGNGAFENCSSLTAVVIPDSVISIGDEAFRGCSKFTSIVIPENVESIGNGVFYECDRLTSITLPFAGANRGANDYDSHFGYIFGYSKTSYEPKTYHYKCYTTGGKYEYYTYAIPKSLKTVVITDDVQIEFSGVDNVTSITIPANTDFLYISRCYALESIQYRGYIKQWNNIYILDEYHRLSFDIHCIDGTIKY